MMTPTPVILGRWAQLRPIKVAAVGDPAANGRIIHRSQLFQGFVAAVM
jgi:hypothetical protein